MSKGATCHACDSPIRFIKSAKSEKLIPCDPEKISSAELKVGDRIVTFDGKVLTMKAVPPDGFEIFGYRPHWGSCVSPELFRRAKA